MLERDESTMVIRENRFDCSDFPDSALIYSFLVEITVWLLWLNTLVQGFQRKKKTERNESSSTMFGKSDFVRWYSRKNIIARNASEHHPRSNGSFSKWTTITRSVQEKKRKSLYDLYGRKIIAVRLEQLACNIRCLHVMRPGTERFADVKIENCSSVPAKN